MINELSADQARRICQPELWKQRRADQTSALETIIGQERAVRALRFGLGIRSKGFNIYVAGLPGTGKTTAVKQFLEEIARTMTPPPDWCYVHDFENSDRPNAIQFPSGTALQFKVDLDNLLRLAIQDIRAAFESEEYVKQQEEIIRSFEQQKQNIFASLNQRAEQNGFILQASPMGLLTVPLNQGKPLSEAEFIALSQEEKASIAERQQKMQEILEASIRQGKIQDKKAREAILALEQRVTEYAIKPHIQELIDKYSQAPFRTEPNEIVQFLERVRADIIENRARFKAEAGEPTESPGPAQEPREVFLRRYHVNILVDNSKLSGAPVVLESNPTYTNLCGRIEQEARFGALTTDFTLIRKGCLQQANHGFLVLPAVDLLRNPLAWETLKRALENQEIAIEDAGEKLGLIFTRSLRPEPIPLEIKVILIGPPDIYQLLLQYDERFSELFKVKADFDSQIEWNETNLNDYAVFVEKVCKSENLKSMDESGLARLVEHGARLAGRQDRLTTRFGEVADVIREASFYATQEQAPAVSAAHVLRAIEERYDRSSLVQERIRELIEHGVIKIDLGGARVGQVNGLSVFDLGDIAFGQPSRITATTAIGREGVIDIEREAKLGGPIHTKGVLILSGYLAEQFAQEKPLSLAARLVFEQNYSGVEGDSASSTELYALLSALAGIPIKQGIAVTGSVNQKGEIQAIGGINEKIEGFFEVCKAAGLSGEQGVIIPTSNVNNLMLKESVVKAIAIGTFHIWSIDSIDDGIEILTGVKAGYRLADGTFEAGSVYARVDARLKGFADRLVEFGKNENRKP
jgi:lon-related putative ATP-dependent protease